MAIVLCTLVKFCTFSSPVLVDFCIIWVLFLNFCLLFGSFWRSCGSPDHFLRAWGGPGGSGRSKVRKRDLEDPPLPGGSLFGHFLQNVLKSAILCCFFVVFFQWQEKVHKIMGKSSKNRVILGSPTLNPIEPARSDRMSAVFSQSWKKCSKMTPKVSHFGVILGAKFATILLLGRPGEQIR